MDLYLGTFPNKIYIFFETKFSIFLSLNLSLAMDVEILLYRGIMIQESSLDDYQDHKIWLLTQKLKHKRWFLLMLQLIKLDRIIVDDDESKQRGCGQPHLLACSACTSLACSHTGGKQRSQPTPSKTKHGHEPLQTTPVGKIWYCVWLQTLCCTPSSPLHPNPNGFPIHFTLGFKYQKPPYGERKRTRAASSQAEEDSKVHERIWDTECPCPLLTCFHRSCTREESYGV